MCTKGICSGVSIDALNQYPWSTLNWYYIDTSANTQVTLHWHLTRWSVDSHLIFYWIVYGLVNTADYWLTVDQVSIECWLSIDQDANQIPL